MVQVNLPSLNNFRDLSAVALASGHSIRPGVVFRGASPHNLSSQDVRTLVDHVGLRTVLDLRSQEEAEKDAGERLLQHSQVCTRHVNLLDEELVRGGALRKLVTMPHFCFLLACLWVFRALTRAVPKLPRGLRVRAAASFEARVTRLLTSVELVDVYWWMLLRRGARLREALQLCAQPQARPLLVHCTHGKDRTGVFVAMLLHICGADAHAIADDYARSDDWGRSAEGRALMAAALPSRLRRNEGAMHTWCAASASSILSLWQRIEAHFGSVDAYLDRIGVCSDTRAAIAASLVQGAAQEAPQNAGSAA